ncbi:hypothetical protein EDD29_8078 [Actinocorallia herbida]|uniref:Uncharacterized protein n=1 Tax=Actinocorallia herbida TaxID=58109 RepID=A0A3N1DA24_9ACTN|nr:hypothetical protein EDD29_8078 [Actinocorallia herbida]
MGRPRHTVGLLRDLDFRGGRDIPIPRSPAAGLRPRRRKCRRVRRARIPPKAFLSRHSGRAPWPG